jgi:hypothetical protein
VPRLQTAVLANAASIEASGLVSVLGAFVDTIYAQQEPHQQLLWFVARLLFDEGDVGHDQTFRVVVEPNEGIAGVPDTPLAVVAGSVNPTLPPQGIDPRFAGGGPLVFPRPIQFPRRGLYHVTFTLNEDLLWDSPLLVRDPPNLT